VYEDEDEDRRETERLNYHRKTFALKNKAPTFLTVTPSSEFVFLAQVNEEVYSYRLPAGNIRGRNTSWGHSSLHTFSNVREVSMLAVDRHVDDREWASWREI
jgi:hypothetical protein